MLIKYKQLEVKKKTGNILYNLHYDTYFKESDHLHNVILGCGGAFTNMTGTIAAQNDPEGYFDYKDCQYFNVGIT